MTNRSNDEWKENLEKVKAIVALDNQIARIKERAIKKKRMDISISGTERFNNPDPATGVEGGDAPRADGHFDVEGHGCVDVYGFTQLDLTTAKDIKTYLKNILSWFQDVYEVFSIKHLGLTAKFAWDTAPFRITWVEWVWTVESLEVLKADLVDEKLQEYFGVEYPSIIRSQGKLFFDKEKEFYESIGRQEVLAYANKEYVRLTNFMWVNPNDPARFLIDEAQRPYDYKDGWSNLMVTSLVWEWLQLVTEWAGQVKIDSGGIKAIDKERGELQKVLVGMQDVLDERKKDFNGQAQRNRNQVGSGCSEAECVSCQDQGTPSTK